MIVLCIAHLAECDSGLVFNFPSLSIIDEFVVVRHHFLHLIHKHLHFVLMNYDKHVNEKIRTVSLDKHVFLWIRHVDIVSIVSGLEIASFLFCLLGNFLLHSRLLFKILPDLFITLTHILQ